MKKNETRGQVFLDTYELLWLMRNIDQALKKKEKEYEGQAKKLKAHTGYQIGMGICKKIGKLTKDSVVSFNSKEARLMSHLIPPVIEALKTSTIPTYEKKIQMHPEMQEHYSKYLDGARSLVIKLEKLKERLDDAS